MKSLGHNKINHHESQAGCIVWVWDAWILDLASLRTHKGKTVKKKKNHSEPLGHAPGGGGVMPQGGGGGGLEVKI